MSAAPHHYPLEAFGGESPPAPDWFSRALDAAPEQGRVRVDGVGIETLSWGQVGTPGVLLLHGAMANADWWRHIAPALAGTRRVTAFSVSGMGSSGWRETYSMDGHAAEALAVAESTGLFEGPERPTAIAHSFGGHVALRLAAQCGERFARAVVLDSMAGSPTSPPRHVVKAGRFPSVADALARFRLLPGQEAEPFILDWFGRRGLKQVQSAEGDHFAWRFDPEFFVKFEPFEDQPALSLARCPLIFLRGDKSTVCTPAVEALQREAAPPGTRFLTLAGASHHVMADQPLRLAETLQRLLDEADPGSAPAFTDLAPKPQETP